ncbi:MAG: nitroreductase family protein, partial [Ktedonobacterales bacterium]
LALALQAPTGGNRQSWQFVVVTDAAKRAALADIYRHGWDVSLKMQAAQIQAAGGVKLSPERAQTLERIRDSSQYLADHMHEVPAMLIPCIRGRTDTSAVVEQSGQWGSILPAVWSFMLAARSRGLGSSWTTVHLFFEQDAATLLGIPYEKVMQTALIPLAYTKGTEFAPGPREPLEKVLHWDQW